MVKKKFPKELRGRKAKLGEQNSPDFYRVRIVMFLFAYPNSRITDMRENGEYRIGTMNKGLLRLLLLKMVDEDWLDMEISKDNPMIKRYSLKKKGLEMLNFIRNLRDKDENNPLFRFDSLKGIKSLG